MAKVTFSSKWGSVKVQKKVSFTCCEKEKSAEESVREIKKSRKNLLQVRTTGKNHWRLMVLYVPVAAVNLPNPNDNF